MYCSVPHTLHRKPPVSTGRKANGEPKGEQLQDARGIDPTLVGFRSQKTTPLEWRYRASATVRATWTCPAVGPRRQNLGSSVHSLMHPSRILSSRSSRMKYPLFFSTNAYSPPPGVVVPARHCDAHVHGERLCPDDSGLSTDNGHARAAMGFLDLSNRQLRTSNLVLSSNPAVLKASSLLSFQTFFGMDGAAEAAKGREGVGTKAFHWGGSHAPLGHVDAG